MRHVIDWSPGWLFIKDTRDITARGGEEVDLPHTWNATDGQDGGNDYFRGSCLYRKLLKRAELPEADCYYLELRGANSSADVYVNGEAVAHHDGGYSTFRACLTGRLTEVTEIAVLVDNSKSDRVYPQMADFTFYGGLYRGVSLIAVDRRHFDLSYFGGSGLKITPTVRGEDAEVEIEVFTTPLSEDERIVYTVYDREEEPVGRAETAAHTVTIPIPGAHLWQGRHDPYLYRCTAELLAGGRAVDRVESRFGCRSFRIDPDRGFLLNGEEYPLRGVSRHQDRLGIGNALLPEHHAEDMALILELGASSVRLAHYQHDELFYDLCDENGIVVWAEIPYISKHMPLGRENTVTQMTELITQCYNHASIAIWGLSNEISIGGRDPDMLENHRILNDLAHRMDRTRLTAVAAVSMCDPDDPYLRIPDAVAYNHYFGWYGGDTSMNGPWLDRFHERHPSVPIGVSEYGCEGLNWHSSEPRQGDYTEEYQAYYHEELIKQLFSRPYLFATYVWNMFDFGADARTEGGESGQNHKGLVTMDRRYRKDAFYAYRAWLSDVPFVHLCGKRYVDRTEEITRVTIYSNLPEVELLANGVSLGRKRAPDHFFRFDVRNEGETQLEARAGEYSDRATVRRVERPNPDYVLRETGSVLSWFEIGEVAGRFSLLDRVDEIGATLRGKLFLAAFGMKIRRRLRAARRAEAPSGGFEIDLRPGSLLGMIGGFSVLRLTGMLGMAGIRFTREELLGMNRRLNRIPKPKPQSGKKG